jgi:predicted RND superfamily exporter protein
MTRTLNALTRSMVKSYAIALAIITPLMILLIGNIRGGLVSMIPNLSPILLTMGLMGWTGIPLDVFTVLIGCIAIGLAVDDTIHFIHSFRGYYERSGDSLDAVRRTIETTGQALLFTTLVLSAGFFIFMLSSLGNLYNFGMLTGFTIAAALVANIVIAPALLVLITRKERVAVRPSPLDSERMDRRGGWTDDPVGGAAPTPSGLRASTRSRSLPAARFRGAN